MDFGGPERAFEEAERRYAELKRLHEAGTISDQEFDEQLSRLMLQDQRRRWWVKSRSSGEWHYHDGSGWVRGTPLSDTPSPEQNGGEQRRTEARSMLGLLLVPMLLAVVLGGGFFAVAAMFLSSTEGSGSKSAEGERKPASKNKSSFAPLEVAVGETAELDDRTLTVVEVERPYTLLERSEQADSGKEFLRVWVTVKNTGSQSFRYSQTDFRVRDSNGSQERSILARGVPDYLGEGDLAPEETAEGNMVFEVPQGDNNLHLIYERI